MHIHSLPHDKATPVSLNHTGTTEPLLKLDIDQPNGLHYTYNKGTLTSVSSTPHLLDVGSLGVQEIDAEKLHISVHFYKHPFHIERIGGGQEQQLLPMALVVLLAFR